MAVFECLWTLWLTNFSSSRRKVEETIMRLFFYHKINRVNFNHYANELRNSSKYHGYNIRYNRIKWQKENIKMLTL